MTDYLFLVLHVLAAAGAGVVVLWGLRSIRRSDPVLGWLVAAGVLLRASAAVFLFTVSYLNLPILGSLHTGDGFWTIAPDAALYYRTAVDAVDGGLATVPAGSASPGFVRAIAIWMELVGVSPASPPFLNLVVYVLTCWLLVRAGRPAARPLPRAATWPAVVGLTVSPAMVLCSTQVLKDVLLIGLVVAIILGARAFLAPPSPASSGAPTRRVLLGSGIAIVAAIFLLSGIRPYLALMFWLALAMAAVWSLRALPRRPLASRIAPTTALLVTVWAGFMTGAGIYYDHYERLVRGSMASASERFLGVKVPGLELAAPVAATGTVVRSVEGLREGFVLSGGSTNFVKRKPATAPPAGARGEAVSVGEGRAAAPLAAVSAVAVGLAAMFVPITALRALSFVEFDGGRGFLLVTDLDTVLFDLTAAAVIVLLVRNRKALRPVMPFTVLLVTLASVLTILLAYIVTNYGTLFRLRLMAFTLIWLLPLTLTLPRAAPDAGEERAGAQSA